MEHIKLASSLGVAAAFAKFAEEHPEMAEKKKTSSKYRNLLLALGGLGIGAGGLYGAHQMGMFGGGGAAPPGPEMPPGPAGSPPMGEQESLMKSLQAPGMQQLPQQELPRDPSAV